MLIVETKGSLTKAFAVQVIVEKMIEYLRGTTDDVRKADVVKRIADLAETFAPDSQWYIDIMNQVKIMALFFNKSCPVCLPFPPIFCLSELSRCFSDFQGDWHEFSTMLLFVKRGQKKQLKITVAESVSVFSSSKQSRNVFALFNEMIQDPPGISSFS